MAFIKKKNSEGEKQNQSLKPSYNDSFKTSPLKFLCIIVNKYQGEFYIDLLVKKNGVSAAFLLNGHGTATRDIYSLLNISETKKDVVMALVREDKIDEIMPKIEERFKISNSSKGIAFTLSSDSIIGVLAYRFFTDTKENVKKEER